MYKSQNLGQILAGKTYMRVNIVVNNFRQGCLCKSMQNTTQTKLMSHSKHYCMSHGVAITAARCYA